MAYIVNDGEKEYFFNEVDVSLLKHLKHDRQSKAWVEKQKWDY